MNHTAITITGTTTSVAGTTIESKQSLVLSLVERRDLSRLQTVVRRDSNALVRVGIALLEIKERKLYREKFPSFEAYCQAVFGWGRSHAYRLVDAAEVCGKMSPMGDISAPTSERQVRALRGLSGEKAGAAWKLAVTKANGKPITGAIVKEAAAEVSSSRGEPVRERMDWQIRIQPLLQKALSMVKQGEREPLELIIQRISLLLLIGQGSKPINSDSETET